MVTSEDEFKFVNASVVFGRFKWDVGFRDAAEKFEGEKAIFHFLDVVRDDSSLGFFEIFAVLGLG